MHKSYVPEKQRTHDWQSAVEALKFLLDLKHEWNSLRASGPTAAAPEKQHMGSDQRATPYDVDKL